MSRRHIDRRKCSQLGSTDDRASSIMTPHHRNVTGADQPAVVRTVRQTMRFTAELQNGKKKPMMKTPPSGQPSTPQTVPAAWMSFGVK